MTGKNISSKQAKTPLFRNVPILMILFVIISAFYQCANIQRPTGGPKDSIPPKLISVNPPNLTTNFSSKKVVFVFDEFIRLENQQREISYSPDMEKRPNFVVKRKELHVELPDSLEKETTYLINFGNSIVDNNERNPIKGFQYVFATGDKIDSLSIEGTVTNALKNAPEIDATVLLIPESQDSLIFGKKRANIFAVTDSSGRFKLSYLKEGNYKIYALKETNNDRIYNNTNENIGFINETIKLTKDTANVQIYTSQIKEENFRVLDRGITTNSIVWLKLNKDLDNPEVEIIEPKELNTDKIVKIHPKKDSLSLWLNSIDYDTLNLRIYDDILQVQDSITIRKPRNTSYVNTINLTDNLLANKVDRVKHIEINTSHPIESIDRNKIKIQEDSLVRTNYQLIKDSLDSEKIIIRYNWKEKINYSIEIDSGAFIGKFNETNLAFKKNFTMDENAKYGNIKLTIHIPDTSFQYIVQILNEKQDVVLRTDYIMPENSKMQYQIGYTNYLEGKYNIRIIYDQNNNGKWDPGNIKSWIQPERTWYFNKVISIRANWDQEENITIPPL